MGRLLIALRATGAVAATVVAVAIPVAVRVLTLNHRATAIRVGCWASHLWSKTLCRLIRLRIDARDLPPEGSVHVVASNHLSYLDIIVLGSLYRTHFVAKDDIRQWPMFGWISSTAGTLFVDRKRARDAIRVIPDIQRMLDLGIVVTVFPEGGTSRGEAVRPFQAALLEAAARSGISCYGVSLSYETDLHEPPSETICWTDGDHIGRHMLRVIRTGRIDARVVFAPSAIHGDDRKELARRLQDHVKRTFVPLRQQTRGH